MLPVEVKELREELILNCFWVLFSDLQMQHRPSKTTLSVVYPLSHSMCVNQKPQRVEGLREMDIDVMWMRIFLLCIGVRHSCAVMCPLTVR